MAALVLRKLRPGRRTTSWSARRLPSGRVPPLTRYSPYSALSTCSRYQDWSRRYRAVRRESLATDRRGSLHESCMSRNPPVPQTDYKENSYRFGPKNKPPVWTDLRGGSLEL